MVRSACGVSVSVSVAALFPVDGSVAPLGGAIVAVLVNEPVAVLATFERKADSYVTAIKVGIREFSDPSLEVKKAWLPVDTQVITRDIAGLLGDPGLEAKVGIFYLFLDHH